ncbi:MAG: nucleotidyltransferase family protein [Ignavibacteriaceae bacterium]
MKKNLSTLLTEIKTLLPYLTEKYSVQSIEVFGSYVKNEQNENSDLDLLVTFSQVPGLIKFIALKNFLSDSLEVNVDLVMKNSLKPRISGFILNEAVPV